MFYLRQPLVTGIFIASNGQEIWGGGGGDTTWQSSSFYPQGRFTSRTEKCFGQYKTRIWPRGRCWDKSFKSEQIHDDSVELAIWISSTARTALVKSSNIWSQRINLLMLKCSYLSKARLNTHRLPSWERRGGERESNIKNREVNKEGALFLIIAATLRIKA